MYKECKKIYLLVGVISGTKLWLCFSQCNILHWQGRDFLKVLMGKEKKEIMALVLLGSTSILIKKNDVLSGKSPSKAKMTYGPFSSITSEDLPNIPFIFSKKLTMDSQYFIIFQESIYSFQVFSACGSHRLSQSSMNPHVSNSSGNRVAFLFPFLRSKVENHLSLH